LTETLKRTTREAIVRRGGREAAVENKRDVMRQKYLRERERERGLMDRGEIKDDGLGGFVPLMDARVPIHLEPVYTRITRYIHTHIHSHT